MSLATIRSLPLAVRALLLALVGALLVGYLAHASDRLNQRVQAYARASEADQKIALSDMFMPWYGSRALIEGRDVYSEAFTTELHGLLYGRRLQSTTEIYTRVEISDLQQAVETAVNRP